MMSVPLRDAIEGLGFVRLFLDNSFNAVIFFLVILSILLIYSLMLSDVDEKTYEYGMIRALGFQHKSLITMITM